MLDRPQSTKKLSMHKTDGLDIELFCLSKLKHIHKRIC